MTFKFRELNGKKELEDMGEDNYREGKSWFTGIDKERKAQRSRENRPLNKGVCWAYRRPKERWKSMDRECSAEESISRKTSVASAGKEV